MAHNGIRSRASTPGELDYPDSSSALSEPDKESESAGKIKVGPEYQASIPEMLQPLQRNPEKCAERGLLMWAPSSKASDTQLAKYTFVSKDKYCYSLEQSLGMLFWHNYNFEKAIADLPNYTPQPEEWTVEDKVLFEQAFSFHGKNFHKIHQMLPEKSIHTLVKYYYLWKKSRSRTSLMDRQAKKLASQREDGSYQLSERSSDSDDDNKQAGESENNKSQSCSNCGIACLITNNTAKGIMCNTCYNHFKKHGSLRPTVGPMRGDKRDRHHSMTRKKSHLPKGMYINHEDLVEFSKEESGDMIMSKLEQQVADLKRQIQNNKQTISMLKRKTLVNIAPYRLPDVSPKINARWTNDELLLAVQAVRKYGKKFDVIAEVLGTKTPQHLRMFYTNYRKRYNLDHLVKEFEEEHGSQAVSPAENESSCAASSGTCVPVSAQNCTKSSA